MSEHEFDRQLVYAVNRDNKAAWEAMLKICRNPKPGAVIPLSQAEFDALKDDVLVLSLPSTAQREVAK